MDSINISGIRLFAHHGVFPEEKQNGQTFLVDVNLLADLSDASRSDRLEDTIDYAAVCETVREVMTANRFDLIERAAGAVCDALLETFSRVSRASVTIKKPEIRLCCDIDSAAVTIDRLRGVNNLTTNC